MEVSRAVFVKRQVHVGYEQDFCDIHPSIMHLFYFGTDHLNRKNSIRSPIVSISDELKANILRYHHVEKWRVGTISRQLNVHHSTIKRALAETGVPKRSILVQSSMIEPYVPFILDTLQKFPTLTARRLYEMVKVI